MKLIVALAAIVSLAAASNCGFGCFSSADCSGDYDYGVPADGSCHELSADGQTAGFSLETGDGVTGTMYLYMSVADCPDSPITDVELPWELECAADPVTIDGHDCASLGKGCV